MDFAEGFIKGYAMFFLIVLKLINKRKAKLSAILKYVSLKHVKSEILVDHRQTANAPSAKVREHMSTKKVGLSGVGSKGMSYAFHVIWSQKEKVHSKFHLTGYV
jgi:hypothetical protein